MLKVVSDVLQIKKLERQVLTNPTDGPTRKRKQEVRGHARSCFLSAVSLMMYGYATQLEDTLKSVVKKRKEVRPTGGEGLSSAILVVTVRAAVCLGVDGGGGAEAGECGFERAKGEERYIYRC